AGGRGLDWQSFEALLGRLGATGLLQRFDANDPLQQRVLSREGRGVPRALIPPRTVAHALQRGLAGHDAAEGAREGRTRGKRTPAARVHSQWATPPLAIGLIVAYAKEFEGGRLCEHYDFRPAWITDPNLDVPAGEGWPIYLFSHYVWSSAQNL